MLVAVLVSACSADEFSVASGAGGSGGAGGGKCAVPTHLTLTASCAACLEIGCCADLTACDGDAACPACLASPASCGTGPFVALSGCAKAACPAECTFGTGGTGAGGAGGAGAGGGSGGSGGGSAGNGGSSSGAAACLTFAGYGNLSSKSCDTCTQDACHSQQIVDVCGKNPADACNASCGTNATCFCNCMTSQPPPCGATVASTYSCFTEKCGVACN
jgi:hypothetical protein